MPDNARQSADNPKKRPTLRQFRQTGLCSRPRVSAGALRAPGRATLTWGPIRAGFAIEVQVNEGSADEYQRNVDTYF